MRYLPSRSWACDRARHAVSLRLDGELSQLERALLERHLDRCPACADFAADTAVLTNALRAAPLVELERPVELPLRRRVGVGIRSAGAWAAAASVAAAALFAMIMLPAQQERVTRIQESVSYQKTNQDLRDLRILRIAQMTPTGFSLSHAARGQQLDT
jgi:anti-sigma factor RsiW